MFGYSKLLKDGNIQNARVETFYVECRRKYLILFTVNEEYIVGPACTSSTALQPFFVSPFPATMVIDNDAFAAWFHHFGTHLALRITEIRYEVLKSSCLGRHGREIMESTTKCSQPSLFVLSEIENDARLVEVMIEPPSLFGVARRTGTQKHGKLALCYRV